jgi:hypothetical protein
VSSVGSSPDSQVLRASIIKNEVLGEMLWMHFNEKPQPKGDLISALLAVEHQSNFAFMKMKKFFMAR